MYIFCFTNLVIYHIRTGCIMNAARSLDLLRSNLQKYINKEIDDVIQTYINVSIQNIYVLYNIESLYVCLCV